MELKEVVYYEICPPVKWATTLKDDELINAIQETDFAKEQIEQGKDFCYFLNRDIYTDQEKEKEYVFMAYTLIQSENLETSSRFDVFLSENQYLKIHRISVLRDGKLIDKLPDTTIKVLDNEEGSGKGVLSNSKKLNVLIKDLRLGDVLIREDTTVKVFGDKEFMRKDFFRYLFIVPDIYWAYGQFNFRIINHRKNRISYKDSFFRDHEDNIIPGQLQHIEPEKEFSLNYQNYTTKIDVNRQIYPFIHFASEANWEELSTYVSKLYQQTIEPADLKGFAPQIVQKLDEINAFDEKIQYAIEYVQDNIYYLFNQEVMNGHQPQEPVITYETKQGDCKAKTVLLKVILDYLGVESAPVLVHSNVDFYQKYYLPSLFNFDHVILEITKNGKSYLIDPTHRNNRGTLENRSLLRNYQHYLKITENEVLANIAPVYFDKYALEERVHLKAKGNQGELTVETCYRYSRADSSRDYFRNTDKNKILDTWNSSMFYNLNFNSDRNNADFRDVFKNSSIEVIKDDKIKNEFIIRYRSTVENPYTKDANGDRFLAYWDFNVLKRELLDYQSDVIPFWHHYESEFYEVLLETDQKIDTKEYHTAKELNINDKLFDYSSTKEITPHSGKITIEYRPLSGIEIEIKDFEAVKKSYQRISDSNFGIGIDIIEPGIFNMLKHKFKKK